MNAKLLPQTPPTHPRVPRSRRTCHLLPHGPPPHRPHNRVLRPLLGHTPMHPLIYPTVSPAPSTTPMPCSPPHSNKNSRSLMPWRNSSIDSHLIEDPVNLIGYRPIWLARNTVAAQTKRTPTLSSWSSRSGFERHRRSSDITSSISLVQPAP